MSCSDLGRFRVIRNAFDYAVTDTRTGHWVKRLRGREAAHRLAHRLNEESRHNDGSIADCDFCGAGPGDCHCGEHIDGSEPELH